MAWTKTVMLGKYFITMNGIDQYKSRAPMAEVGSQVPIKRDIKISISNVEWHFVTKTYRMLYPPTPWPTKTNCPDTCKVSRSTSYSLEITSAERGLRPGVE
jgi:hypothetical protein